MKCEKCGTEITANDVSVNNVGEEFGIDLSIICPNCEVSGYAFVKEICLDE